ncbi:MAG: VTT domain-containing protein [Candidatus Thermoplasmatota archaeon]|nr:VTT domain-containing protein [Candidatus Thermoplasmatota archaeon]
MIGEDFILEFFNQFGPFALALLSFTEAIIQPIPPDVMFLPMAYDERNSVNMLLWLWFIVTFASVLGAIVGHTLGKVYGTKLLDRFGKPQHRERLESLFEKYGTWGMFIAAVSPLPYKVFGWIAGASDMKLQPFILAGIFGRGLRFGLEAMLIYFYGDAAMNAVTWLLDHEIIMAVVLIAVLGIAYWWLTSKKLQQTEIA